MSMESDLVALLKTVCPRVYPDVAPANPTRPFITWQVLGGEPLRFLDKTPGSQRNTYLQVSVYSATRSESLALMRSAEDAMCASALFTATPLSEPLGQYEEDTSLYGAQQRFSIWANR